MGSLFEILETLSFCPFPHSLSQNNQISLSKIRNQRSRIIRKSYKHTNTASTFCLFCSKCILVLRTVPGTQLNEGRWGGYNSCAPCLGLQFIHPHNQGFGVCNLHSMILPALEAGGDIFSHITGTATYRVLILSSVKQSS